MFFYNFCGGFPTTYWKHDHFLTNVGLLLPQLKKCYELQMQKLYAIQGEWQRCRFSRINKRGTKNGPHFWSFRNRIINAIWSVPKIPPWSGVPASAPFSAAFSAPFSAPTPVSTSKIQVKSKNFPNLPANSKCHSIVKPRYPRALHANINKIWKYPP